MAIKNLVIIRAGKASLHKRWLDVPRHDRDFDLVVSYYDHDSYVNHVDEDGVSAVFYAGGKWDGLYKTFGALGEKLDNYEYVWLPDDDIDTDVTTINELFSLMRKHSLTLAQPSLTHDSYFTHFLFLQCRGLELRKTNYIEIMVPCLSVDLLKAVKDNFKNTMSGFGLDYLWCRLPESGNERAAILDSVAVRHTRPVGKFLIGNMRQNGIAPKDEEARLNRLYGIKERITPLAYMAQTRRGMVVRGRAFTGVFMALMYGIDLVLRRDVRRTFGPSRIIQLLRRQLTRRLDLSVVYSLNQKGVNE